MSIGVAYFTFASFDNISLTVRPLCLGVINTWFSLNGSRQSDTFPFGTGISAKLLHHYMSCPHPNSCFAVFLISL